MCRKEEGQTSALQDIWLQVWPWLGLMKGRTPRKLYCVRIQKFRVDQVRLPQDTLRKDVEKGSCGERQSLRTTGSKDILPSLQLQLLIPSYIFLNHEKKIYEATTPTTQAIFFDPSCHPSCHQ